MRLNELLDTYWRHASERAPSTAAALVREARELAASGRLDRAVRTGDPVPDVALPDSPDGRVRLHDLLRTGPLVVVFYRGRWCPFDTLELRAWQRVLPELRALGAGLLAVSPQDEREVSLTRERDRLEFHLVADPGNAIAQRFGVAYRIEPGMRDAYAASGFAAGRDGTLPVPAVYVVGTDGRVAWSHVDADWRRRAEPGDVVRVVAGL